MAINGKKGEKMSIFWNVVDVDPDLPMKVGREYRIHFDIRNPHDISEVFLRELVQKLSESLPSDFGVFAWIPLFIQSNSHVEGVLTYFLKAKTSDTPRQLADRIVSLAKDEDLFLRFSVARAVCFRWGLVAGMFAFIGAGIGLSYLGKKSEKAA